MLFEVENLKIDFDTAKGKLYAVRDASFYLKKGEILGIVGESGSGKSVTALSLLKLLPNNGVIRDGIIKYKGRSIFGFNKEELLNYRGNEIGMIFQEPSKSFDPIYSIGKCLEESLLTHNNKLSKDEVYRRSLKLLNEVNIPKPEERLINFPHQFSGGLLQRIMIAIALSSDPDVLIADEPTTALDVTIQSQIIGLLLKLRKKRDLSIIFISHDLALVGNISDRIMVMYNGLVLEEGPSNEIINSPLHPYTKALLDSHPKFGDHYSNYKLKTIRGTVPNPMFIEPGCPFAERCDYVKDECLKKVPPMIKEKHHHRCLIKGVKK